MSHAQTPPPGGGGSGGNVKCPIYLLAEFNSVYFYQEKDCVTNQVLTGYKRYFSKVKTGCNGTTSCNCTEPEPTPNQAEYADPQSRIFVPFGGGASSHQGPAKQLVAAGGKKFVVISMRFKGMPTTTGAPDNELDVVVQFGQEVDPGTPIPGGNNGTLSGNDLTFNGQTFFVTTKSMTPPG